MSRRDNKDYEYDDSDEGNVQDEIKRYNDRLFKKGKKKLYIAGAILLAFIAGFMINGSMSGMTGMVVADDIGADAVGDKVIGFLNEMAEEDVASLISVTKESGLYLIALDYGGQEMSVYATMDGEFVIPQVIALEIPEDSGNGGGETTDSASCLNEANIDTSQLDSCMDAADAEFSITANYEDEDSWLSGYYPLYDVDKELNELYGVGGSPTLVINGVYIAPTEDYCPGGDITCAVASVSRTAEGYLGAICNAFTEQPTECQGIETISIDLPKTDKPTIDLFVMSYCPYGVQAEQAMLPVMELLGDEADINIRFVYYAMHDWTEIEENTRQYCIQKEEPDKYIDYLSCFVGESSGTTSTGSCG